MTAAESPPSRRRDPAVTRQRILEAARELFLATGYRSTSLDDIASAAGVTKPTVYQHFGSKRQLFGSVVEHSAQQRLATIDSLRLPSGNPKSDLELFGNAFLKMVLSADARRWHRLMAAETPTDPELGTVYFSAGPQQLLGMVSDYLRQQQREGRLKIPNCQRAAEQLVGLLLGVDLLRSQIGLAAPNSQQRKRRCRQAVAIFLAAYEVRE